MACPSCGSFDTRATKKGILFDERVCRNCRHEFTALNGASAARWGFRALSLGFGGFLLDDLLFGSADAAEAASDVADSAESSDHE